MRLTYLIKPHTGLVKEGGVTYFQAVFPDLAATEACIGCHDAHRDSPKRNFKIHDVIAAIMIGIRVKWHDLESGRAGDWTLELSWDGLLAFGSLPDKQQPRQL